MNDIWNDMPVNLRDVVRRKTNLFTWMAMDQADARSRLNLTNRIATALKRLKDLLHVLADERFMSRSFILPPRLKLITPEVTVSVARLWSKDEFPVIFNECTINDSQVEIQNNIAKELERRYEEIAEKNKENFPNRISAAIINVDKVLLYLAPLVRRCVDVGQTFAVELCVGTYHKSLLQYVGNDLSLHSDHAYMMDLQTGRFRARFKLLLDLIARSHAEMYIVKYFLTCVPSQESLYKRKDDRFDYIENPAIRKTPGYNIAQVFARVMDIPNESAPIELICRTSGTCGTMASFEPPLYNITGRLRVLL